MRTTVGLCLSLIAPAVVGAQAPVDGNWAGRTATAASLAVMIDAGEDEGCHGAGFIVGIVPPKIFILTAEHVVKEAQDQGALARMGARFRFARPYDRQGPIEKRVKARVLKADAAIDLAALEVEDAELAGIAASRLDLKQAGDAEHLVAGDSIYAVGCGNGLDFDMPAKLTKVLPASEGNATFPVAFDRGYIREGYSGGPLIHMFHTTGTIVGMAVQVGDVMGRGAGLQQVLARARAWKVPVTLTAPSTDADCTYKLSSTAVVLTGEKREAEVHVETAAQCPWGIRSQTDAILIEREGYWFEASGPDGKGEGPRQYVGPGRVLLSAGPAAPCNGRPQHAVARVAGQMIQVQYDGRCNSPAPPGRVARNPAYVRTPPASPPGAVAPPPPPRPIDTSVTSANAVREAIGMLNVDRGVTFGSWGCNLHGCRFFEGGVAALCSRAVSRVELGDSPDRFSFDLDRSNCTRQSNQRILCVPAPSLPFSIAPGKRAYARIHLGDGSTQVTELPISNMALRQAGPPLRSITPDHWTVLEPVPGRSKMPAPFAAVVYAPNELSPGGYTLFVGEGQCDGPESGSSTTSWTITDGSGAQLGRPRPHAGGPILERPSGEVPLPEVEGMTAKVGELIVEGTAGAGRKLGPYVYRFDPKAPILAAAARLGPPKVRCAHDPSRPATIQCAPTAPLAWLTARGVRFGPDAGRLPSELTFGASQPRAFAFDVPAGWPAVYAQVVGADGRAAAPVRVQIDP